MMSHEEIWQPRDGVFGVQYKRRDAWGLVVAVGHGDDAEAHMRSARYATTRLVRAEGGKWRPVPHTVRIGEDMPVMKPKRFTGIAYGHIDRIRHLTGVKG